MVGFGRPGWRRLHVATALVCGLSCTEIRTSPTSPTVYPPGEEPTPICHYVPELNAFLLTVVVEREVASHMEHGDGRLNELVPGQSELKFGQNCAFIPLVLSAMTFDRLPGLNGTPFTSHEELGLIVTAIMHPWEVLATYGRPLPCVVFRRGPLNPQAEGEVEVVSRDGLFMLSSVDLYSSTTSVPYRITGSRKSTSIFTMEGATPHTFGAFSTVSSTETLLIDRLTIRLTNLGAPCCGNPMGIDNIVVKR